MRLSPDAFPQDRRPDWLTDEKLQLLEDSIAAARNPGNCRFEEGGQPCCVIGQLSVRMGKGARQLEEFDGDFYGTFPQIYQLIGVCPAFPEGLVDALRRAWDLTLGIHGEETEDTRRDVLRQKVLTYVLGR
jgi:hypothetical protein